MISENAIRGCATRAPHNIATGLSVSRSKHFPWKISNLRSFKKYTYTTKIQNMEWSQDRLNLEVKRPRDMRECTLAPYRVQGVSWQMTFFGDYWRQYFGCGDCALYRHVGVVCVCWRFDVGFSASHELKATSGCYVFLTTMKCAVAPRSIIRKAR